MSGDSKIEKATNQALMFGDELNITNIRYSIEGSRW
jgi:hypothetical protein